MTRKSQVKHRHKQTRDHRLPVPSQSSRGTPAVSMASTCLNAVGGKGGGGHRGSASPSAPPFLASSSSSPGAQSCRPLPDVCYITYPRTPDLTAMGVPASLDFSLECGLENGNSDSGGDIGSMPTTVERTGGPSTEFPQDPDEAAGAVAAVELMNSSPPADPSSREAQDGSYGGHMDSDGVDGKRPLHCFEQPSAAEANHGRASTSEIRSSGRRPSLAHGTELEAGHSQQQQQQKRHQQLREDDGPGGETLRRRVSVSVGGEGAEAGRAGQGGRTRRRRSRIRGRDRLSLGNVSSSRRARMKTGPINHPLGASRVFPTLPGVDEHQRPVFWLAEMHENLRKNR